MEYGTLAERRSLQRRAGFWAGGAVSSVIVATIAISFVPPAQGGPFNLLAPILLAILLLPVIPWTVGCGYYARAKGWPAGFGLLGLLTCFGLLVLVLLPDRWDQALRTPIVDAPELTNDPR